MSLHHLTNESDHLYVIIHVGRSVLLELTIFQYWSRGCVSGYYDNGHRLIQPLLSWTFKPKRARSRTRLAERRCNVGSFLKRRVCIGGWSLMTAATSRTGSYWIVRSSRCHPQTRTLIWLWWAVPVQHVDELSWWLGISGWIDSQWWFQSLWDVEGQPGRSMDRRRVWNRWLERRHGQGSVLVIVLTEYTTVDAMKHEPERDAQIPHKIVLFLVNR